MQVRFEGDPASALVTFANAVEAEAAFSAPDAVLGNRFIEMFFNYDRNAKSVKERLGGQPPKKEEGDEADKAKKEEAEARRAEQAKKSSEIARSKQEDEGMRRSDIKCVHCKDKA